LLELSQLPFELRDSIEGMPVDNDATNDLFARRVRDRSAYIFHSRGRFDDRSHPPLINRKNSQDCRDHPDSGGRTLLEQKT
jgi:hypothetical protein